MFDTVLGLPVHALVVHGVVVLLPLMALVTLVWAWRRPGRATAGWLVVAADAVVMVMTFVAKQSGEALQRRLGGQAAVEHGHLAGPLPLMAGALLLAAVLVQVHRIRVSASATTGQQVRTALSVLVTAAAGVVVVWTIRVGHSGAEAVWGQIVRNTSQ
ncbi:DUF2231 domain-containing protein [Phycicoccus sp. Root101]|uniref:DUF2231 domain-containing protein n=1 Tax=Phycicoccus sp. Root101 TaxID=1736421 RepID=UPI000702E92F|nr:DUF2231 domain-containing protein [Phycicoccus sp. Root101]KQU70750.1 hypothetical protein ASC58_02945 [Phycicoccus sp. Root101]